MLFNFSSITYQAKADIAAAGLTVSHSHILEVCAALCGYGSHSAYASASYAGGLDDAELVVLDPSYATAKAVKLGLNQPAAAQLADLLADRMKAWVQSGSLASPPKIFVGVESFRDDYLQEYIETIVATSGEMSSAMAETNAYGPDEVYPENISWDSDIRSSVDDWVVESEGTWSADQDPEKVYHGDGGVFSVRIEFDKVDRVGLHERDFEVVVKLEDRYANE